MNIINYFSNLAIPLIFLIILIAGIYEKKPVFDLFLEGAKDGVKIVINIFPTLVGLFVAIGVLKNSGILDLIIIILNPITNIIGFPPQIMPLAILRPISGSASIAVATNIMKTYGVDSKLGLIAATIMGSTETTIYTIAVYTSSVKIKKTKFVLLAALIGDIVRNVCICRNLAIFVVKKLLTKKRNSSKILLLNKSKICLYFRRLTNDILFSLIFFLI